MIKHVANLMEWASPYGCWAALVFLLLQINGAKGGVVHVAGLLGSMRWVAGAVNVALFIISNQAWTDSGYEHFGSPDGVIIAAGPGVRRSGEIVHAPIDATLD